MAAVQAFDATPLGLQVEPDADAAVQESLRRTGRVLLGEGHGIAQTPGACGELIAWFGQGGIALEWHEDLRPWLDRWITHGVFGRPCWGRPGGWGLERRRPAHRGALGWAAPVGSRRTADHPDGRNAGHSPATRGERGGDGSAVVERAGRGDGRPGSRRPVPPGGRLVVAGDLHTRLEPLPTSDPIGAEIGVPMGVELARRRPGLCSIDCVYGPGQFYNLGPRRSDRDGLRGQRLDTPRLIMQQGALLQVPSPREATVPHRELRGPSFG